MKSLIAMSSVLALSLGLGVPAQAASDPSTRADVLAMIQQEATDFVIYRAYAQEAARAGLADVSRLAREVSRSEFDDHVVPGAYLIGLVQGNAANLRTSLEGATAEATRIYPGYAEQAIRDGCPEAAAHFTELARDEARHAARFSRALVAVRYPHSGIGIPVGKPAPQKPFSRSEPRCGGQTLSNLWATVRGEALAYAHYTLYARHAERVGQPRLAQLWRNTASQELGEHLAETAVLVGMVAETAVNLGRAYPWEHREATEVYPVYAERAQQAGAKRAEELFRNVIRDELAHSAAFRQALDDLPPPKA
ncbi:ferritin family protein [Micromonospora echinospora]